MLGLFEMNFVFLNILCFILLAQTTLCNGKSSKSKSSSSKTTVIYESMPPVGAVWETSEMLKGKLAALSEFMKYFEVSDNKVVPDIYWYQYPLANTHIRLVRSLMTSFAFSKSVVRKFFIARRMAIALSWATPEYKAQLLGQYKCELESAIVFREKCEIDYSGCSSVAQAWDGFRLLNRSTTSGWHDNIFAWLAALRGCTLSPETISSSQCLSGACKAYILPYLAGR